MQRSGRKINKKVIKIIKKNISIKKNNAKEMFS